MINEGWKEENQNQRIFGYFAALGNWDLTYLELHFFGSNTNNELKKKIQLWKES